LIFATIGNTDPFDRLVQTVDRWAGQHRQIPVFAQIGEGNYQPVYCQYARYLTPNDYRAKFSQARFVVAHAGMGAIISAVELQKPIILLPRLATLGEQRNEHQLATAKHWRKSPLITVADSTEELFMALSKAIESVPAIATDESPELPSRRFPAGPSLINFVREFVGTHEPNRNASGFHANSPPQDGGSIFLTVGNTDPFDRLVEAVDRWAGTHPSASQVLAQIGNGNYKPRNCKYVRFLSPAVYHDSFSRARLVIGHAGMGTIISALEQHKLIALLPRLAERGEVRNQHQLATIQHFCKLKDVLVADSEVEIGPLLNKAMDLLAAGELVDNSEPSRCTTPVVDQSLIAYIRDFISKTA